MKKLFVVLGVVAFACSFVACKKDCKCTTKISVPDLPEISGTHDAGELSKKDCEDFKVPLPAGADTKYFTYECKSE
jgi:hypothetical protein